MFRSLLGPRLVGGACVLALVLITGSDLLLTSFWDENSMFTDVVSNLLTLAVGVVVVNEFVTARENDRWRLVRHTAVTEFVYAVRPVWVRLCDELGVGQPRMALDELDALLHSEAGQAQLRAASEATAKDGDRRRVVAALLAELTGTVREAVADWSPVMIAARPSAELASRFADFYARTLRLQRVLEEELAGHPQRSWYEIGDEVWIAQRLEAVVLRALELDDAFVARARELVTAEATHDPAFSAA